jgi:release factor glutamine methyltransferase
MTDRAGPPGISFQDLLDEDLREQSGRPGLALCRAWQGYGLADIRGDAVKRLLEIGIEDAALEVRFLLEHVLQPDSLNLALHDPALVSWQRVAHFADLLTARLSRKPLSQILGSQPFWTLDLAVTSDVLTPRADTEALVEAVLARLGDEEAKILDLGTGSGAILLALLNERPALRGLGVDLSSAALAVAGQNAARTGLSERADFIEGRWGAALESGRFDILVSNPPYITREVLAGLEPEVRDHEPTIALDGGSDGLEAYRDIIADIPRLLVPGGLFALEIGYDQANSVRALAAAAGLVDIEVICDLGGNDRVVLGHNPR